MENGLHGLAEKLPSEGLTRPGSFLFDFLAEFNIRESTLATINSTIDIATQARGTGGKGRRTRNRESGKYRGRGCQESMYEDFLPSL